MAATTNPAAIFEPHLQALGETQNNLKTKLSESTPKASNPICQNELEKIHSIYKKVIEASLPNIQNQIDTITVLGQVMQTSATEKQGDFSGTLADLNRQFDALQATHKVYEKQITTLENRIVELISTPDPNVLPTNWWNQFDHYFT